MLTPQTFARICLLQALSPVGRCKTFDASGDGYARGEGFTVAYMRYASSLHLHLKGVTFNTLAQSRGVRSNEAYCAMHAMQNTCVFITLVTRK